MTYSALGKNGRVINKVESRHHIKFFKIFLEPLDKFVFCRCTANSLARKDKRLTEQILSGYYPPCSQRTVLARDDSPDILFRQIDVIIFGEIGGLNQYAEIQQSLVQSLCHVFQIPTV